LFLNNKKTKKKMIKNNTDLKDYKDPSLNIVATLLLTKKILKSEGKIFSNVIVNIFYRS